MNRWLHLAGYALLIFSSQILWVTFSPITTDVAGVMNTSVGNVGILAALFPIVYIVIALPAGRWLDSHFKLALTFGALTVGLGAIARLFFPFSYTWQLVIQFILAIGQPFVINAISAYASRYFPKKSRSLAISLASVSLFLGVIFAMALGPVLYNSGGLIVLYTVFAVPSVLSMVWVMYTVTKKSATISKEVLQSKNFSLKHLLSDKFLWILSGLLAIGLGIFDALSTWVEPLFMEYEIPGSTSGPLLALMIVAGIFGSLFIPNLAAKKDARRTMIVIALIITATAFIAISLWQWVPWIAFWLLLDGFFLLAGFPIIMDWTEKHFGPKQQGTAVGFVMLTSHAGGIVLIYLVKALLSPPYLALGLLALINIMGIFLAFRLPKRNKDMDKNDADIKVG